MTRVVVADDQPVVLQGFAAILGSAPDLEVVGTAADGRALVELVARTEPDVAVVDVRMPVLDGIAATQQVVARHPATRVLVLTTFDLDEYVLGMLRAGAVGFLLKTTGAAALVDAVQRVAAGDGVLAPEVTRRLLADLVAAAPAPTPDVPPDRAQAEAVASLTARERDVLACLGAGMSNADVAAALVITESTAKTHVSRVLAKLGCASRVQAAIVAVEAGVVRDHEQRDQEQRD